MAGRRGSLDEQKIETITKLIRAGNTYKETAKIVGISESVFMVWMRRGRTEQARIDNGEIRKPRKSEEIYVQLLQSVEVAKPMRELKLLEIVESIAVDRDNPAVALKAATWLLERTLPGKYGMRSRDTANAEATAGAIVQAIDKFVGEGDTELPRRTI